MQAETPTVFPQGGEGRQHLREREGEQLLE